MVRINFDDQCRKRDEWLALTETERHAIIQERNQKWFDEVSKRCPQWNCECKHASVFKTQDELIASPFQCPTCDRVYDGRDWFRTTELYNAITDWENLQCEVMWLTGEGSFGDDDHSTNSDDVEEWALDLMDICDAVTHQDVRPIWSLAVAIWSHRRPLNAEEIAELCAAEAACRPLIELLWRRAKTRPSDPDEWSADVGTPEGGVLRRRPKLRPHQQEIIDAIRDAGNRLTTDEILAVLEKKGTHRSEGTTKNTLAALVQFGPLTNKTDEYGRGYGLPEWDEKVSKD